MLVAVGTQANGSRGHASSTVAIVADLDHEHAVRIEERRCLLRIVRTASSPSSPPASAKRGLVPVFRRQFGHRDRRHVRRIADDEVIALLGKVREEIGPDEVDAIGEP